MNSRVANTLEGLKLTDDELSRLRKAFDDPEFRKLFKEYADEIADPDNRKKYEEEIKAIEKEQGMEVEFINPTPGHCLKTRHWPGLSGVDSLESAVSSNNESSAKSHKVFINVCKCDKVGCPTMKVLKNSAGKSISNGMYWSLPHCFTPAHEDMDKNKEKAMVYDVAFHPKAFELATTNPAMRRLLNVTAVEGVQRQFNLCLGKTAEQALHLAQLINSSTDLFSHPVDPNSTEEPVPTTDSGRSRAETIAREEAILRSVHTLKGIAYKGMARPSVIRRRRTDYAQRQAEFKRKTEEDLSACTDPVHRESLSKIAEYTRPFVPKDEPTVPTYTIIHSSDFDLINCRDAPDVNPTRSPDRIKIAIKLPGLTNSNAIDLELTSTKLALNSVKPVAYELHLKLPYEVEDSKGVAQFDKSSSTLIVTVPLKKHSNVDNHCTMQSPTDTAITPVCVQPTSTGDQVGPTSKGLQSKKKRRKRNRRRNSSATDCGSHVSVSHSVKPSSPVRDKDASSENTINHPQENELDLNVISSEEQDTAKPFSMTDLSDFLPPQEPAEASSETSSLLTPESKTISIPISHVGLNQLTVSKDRRLAPVRFRQDPCSISILFSVRGILPETFVLQWSSALPPPLATADLPEEATSFTDLSTLNGMLLLLFHFSSRGSGGCTMEWGVVVRCPSGPFQESHADSCRQSLCAKQEHDGTDDSCGRDESLDSNLTVQFPSATPPQILSVAFNNANAVIVLAKPSTSSCGYRNKTVKAMNDTTWWTSVATGRTLVAGMQECPFEGVESCLSHERKLSLSSMEFAGSTTGGFQLQPSFGQVQVTNLCAECCDIHWSHHETIRDSPISTAGLNEDKAVMSTPSVYSNQYQKENPFVRPSLKGILKQRSYSESSGEEQLTPSGALRFAGLADTCLSSDEFPTASSSDSDEPISSPSSIPNTISAPSTFYELRRRRSGLDGGMRRCISNEKLVASSSLHNNPMVSSSTRQRRRSVNFSTHDQHVAYSPRDTVEALHHTLASRRKKAHRRETRRRHVSESACLSSTNDIPRKRPVSKRNGYGRQNAHFSKNNSVEGHSMCKSGEETSMGQSLGNSGDRPLSFDGSTDDSSVVPSDIPSVIRDSNTQTHESCEGSIPQSSDPISSPEKRSVCAVNLSATPLFELDEE